MCVLIGPSLERDELVRASPRRRASVHRYAQRNGLLYYRAVADDNFRVVIPDDTDLKLRLLFEYHDAPVGGHRGREKTYLTLSRDFYWPRQYKFVRKYIRACEVCQRVKPAPALRAPLQSLPVPTECWESISMDFIFGFPEDAHGNNGILVFVDRFSKMTHLVAVPESITADGCARVFVDTVFKLHGLPRELVSDRDPRFTAEFWRAVFRLLGTRLKMSTSDHPESDGQTERANRVLEEILRGYVQSFPGWSSFLSMAEFAINNSVHASTTHTPFFVNGLRHPRLPSLLGPVSSLTGGGTRESDGPRSSAVDQPVDDLAAEESDDDDAFEEERTEEPYAVDDAGDALDTLGHDHEDHVSLESGNDALNDEMEVDLAAVRESRTAIKATESATEFLLTRQAVVRFVQDSIADAVDRQKRNADQSGRANVLSFNVGDMVLLSTVNLPTHAVTKVGSTKLLPKFIGPFRVLRCLGSAYTLELPRRMRTHPTFYVGCLRPYYQYESVSQSPGTGPALGVDQGAACAPSQDEHAHRPGPGASAPVPQPVNVGDPRSPPNDPCLDGLQGVRRTAHHGAVPPNQLEQSARAAADGANRPALEQDAQASVFPPPPAPLVDAQGQVRWIVEALLRHRDQRTQGRTSRQFLVRWRGYPPSADTWEPRDALLLDVPGLVELYERAQPFPAAHHVRRRAHARRSARRVRRADQ